MGDNFRENIMLFDALISPILLYGSEIWGVDCNDQIEKDPAELVQIKFLKWLLGVNKYCSNNACRAETGRFPIKIEAQYRNFKFGLGASGIDWCITNNYSFTYPFSLPSESLEQSISMNIIRARRQITSKGYT